MNAKRVYARCWHIKRHRVMEKYDGQPFRQHAAHGDAVVGWMFTAVTHVGKTHSVAVALGVWVFWWGHWWLCFRWCHHHHHCANTRIYELGGSTSAYFLCVCTELYTHEDQATQTPSSFRSFSCTTPATATSEHAWPNGRMGTQFMDAFTRAPIWMDYSHYFRLSQVHASYRTTLRRWCCHPFSVSRIIHGTIMWRIFRLAMCHLFGRSSASVRLSIMAPFPSWFTPGIFTQSQQ